MSLRVVVRPRSSSAPAGSTWGGVHPPFPPSAVLRGERGGESHERLRHDRVDVSGKITLRYQGQLYSMGIGRTHARTHVLVLVQNRDIRIINAATGELLRELVLDPTIRYQPTHRPTGPTPKTIMA